jgi:hypothetical protein
MDWNWVTPILMVLFGIAVKRFPFLAKVPNQLIPWINLVLGILVKLVAPTEAHAAGISGTFLGHLAGWLWPPIQVALARLLYETFVRPSEELAGVGIPPSTEPKKKRR